MSFSTQSTTIPTLNELVEALSEGERSQYSSILNALTIDFTTLEKHSSWSEESYTRNCIHDCPSFELILLCWEPGQFTPIHDHGGEECWVKVLEGEFEECIYENDTSGKLGCIKTHISKKDEITYMIDFMGFHRLSNLSNKRSISLHLYAKPIRNCKVYNEDLKEFETKELCYNTVAKLIS